MSKIGIRRLCQLGASSSGLKIDFQTQQPNTKDEYMKMEQQRILSSNCPTRIMCELNVSIRHICTGGIVEKCSPMDFSARSLRPSSCVEDAFVSAIDHLEEQLRSKLPNFHYCYEEDKDEDKDDDNIKHEDSNIGINTKVDGKGERSAYNQRKSEMENIIKKSIPIVKAIELPSPFAIRDMSPRDHSDGLSNRNRYYLYQIDIGEECMPLFGEKEGSSSPQYGILFRDDEDKNIFGSDEMAKDMDIKFALPHVPNQVGKVTLTCRTVVHFPPPINPNNEAETETETETETEIEIESGTQSHSHSYSQSQSRSHLDDLIKFNILLDDSTMGNYGRSKKSKVAGPQIFKRYDKYVEQAKEAMKTSLHERTYMIVPIRSISHDCDAPFIEESDICTSPNQANDASIKIEIDWCLIDKVLTNKLTPYTQWRNERDQGDDTGKGSYSRVFAFQPTSAQIYIMDTLKISKEFTAQSPYKVGDYETAEEYYAGKHEVQLERVDLPLLPASVYVTPNHEIANKAPKEMCYLVQELTVVFPLPWNLLLVHHLLKFFALPLERNIEIRFLKERLLDLSYRIDGKHVSLTDRTSTFLLHLLEEATSVAKCSAYERLEHLGDVVASFFVAMNYFLRNSSLASDEEDLGEFKSKSTQNKVFIKAGLAVGLDRVIHRNTQKSQLKSCYKSNSNQLPRRSAVSIMYNQIADVFESLLGAVFLAANSGEDNGATYSAFGANTIIALLEEFQLPIKDKHIDSGTEPKRWFLPSHPCLIDGYDLDSDPAWGIQINAVKDILDSSIYVSSSTLFNGVDNLVRLLKDMSFETALEVPNEPNDKNVSKRKILLSCALFDDSLKDYDEDNMNEIPSIRLARVRENLFFVGDAALNLSIATECYRRYPDASAGDLHILRHCCIGDIIIAYLMMKHKVNTFLYDQDADYGFLASLVNHFDEEGRKSWDEKGGWVLGVDEFRKRWGRAWCPNNIENLQSSSMSGKTKSPQYAGIGGGTFFGTMDPSAKVLTKDLAFSFKCIIGALVLSIGVQQMWHDILPIFEELLILTPDEIRDNFKTVLTTPSGKNSAQQVRSLRDKYGLGWSAT